MTIAPQTLQKLALIGLIDTPAMHAAINSMDTITDLHSFALRACLGAIQSRIANGESAEGILAMGYQDILIGLPATDDSLTQEQRLQVLGTMVATVCAELQSMITELGG